MRSKWHDGKYTCVLYLGDWDPSGEDMQRNLTKRVCDHARNHFGEWSTLQVVRVAIFDYDIEDFNLPPLKLKDTDPRASNFKREYGDEAVELDALPPTELRARLRRAIERLIDHEAWDRAKLVEQAQRETCVRYAGTFRDMAREHPRVK